MFAKKQRIQTGRFNELMQQGMMIRSRVLYTRFMQGDRTRFAVSVPKKIVRGAVERHLIKRRVMATLRDIQEKFPTGDYIIFITKDVLGSRGLVLQSILEDLAEKVASQLVRNYNNETHERTLQ